MSLLSLMIRRRLSRIRRERADRLMREIAKRYDDADPYKKCVLVAIDNAIEFSIGWNRERLIELKKKIKQ